MKAFTAAYVYLLIFMLCQCSLPDYNSNQSNVIVVQAIIDPSEELAISFWQLQGIGEAGISEQDSFFEVSLYENKELVYSEINTSGFANTGHIPNIGSVYNFEIKSVENEVIAFYSNNYKVISTPLIESYVANDSIRTLGDNFTQVYQQIQIQLDTSEIDHPYFAYEITSDSSSLFGQSEFFDTLQTSAWTPKIGTFCPEIGSPVFFEGDYNLLNLTCRENKGLLDFESTDFRPNEHRYMLFTICTMDDHSIGLMRQVSQNDLYDAFKFDEEQFLSIFITKDDFPRSGDHYELILSRACSKYKIEF